MTKCITCQGEVREEYDGYDHTYTCWYCGTIYVSTVGSFGHIKHGPCGAYHDLMALKKQQEQESEELQRYRWWNRYHDRRA